uniref:Uncharacterized protein n=1 Tax=Rhizophora mucronata TaxID=61149 RepID=A0A2P2NZD0_RHIMU
MRMPSDKRLSCAKYLFMKVNESFCDELVNYLDVHDKEGCLTFILSFVTFFSL